MQAYEEGQAKKLKSEIRTDSSAQTSVVVGNGLNKKTEEEIKDIKAAVKKKGKSS